MSDFTVNRIALHLINKKDNKLDLADHEIDLKAFNPTDLAAVRIFFSGHLRLVWDAAEGNTIRAAKFLKASEIRKHYSDLKTGTSQFLQQSRQMAESLFAIAPKNSSTGLLMALWLEARDDNRPFLALFKMDPSRSDKIALLNRGDQLLLDLAVKHIDQALPEPGDRVLKWAVTPHPTRQYDVKIKDSQSSTEPALYFMKFLGCEAQSTEKQQLNQLFKDVPLEAVDRLRQEIKQETSIDARVLSASVDRSKVLTKFHKEVLSKNLATAEAKNIAMLPRTILGAKVGYRLANGIVIKGPLAAMRDVAIKSLGKNEVEFRIRTTKYESFYD